jgi:hypothetical protein
MILSFVCFSVFADSPLTAPKSFRICSNYVNVCAYSEVDKNTTIYSVKAKFELKELYQIPGWHRSVSLSSEGGYVVIGYGGLNLVSRDVTEDEVMLTVYKHGKLFKKYTLGQLYISLDSLKPTISHFYWGYIKSVGFDGIEVETTEGTVFIDLETDKIYLPNES